MQRLIEIAKRPGVRRAAIALYVACLAALIMAFVAVSLLQVDHSAYIQASPTLEQGRPNAMRGFVLHAPTGRRLTDANIEALLTDQTDVDEWTEDRLAAADPRIIAQGKTEASGLIHLDAQLDTDGKYGDASLVIVADGPQVEKFAAGTTVQVTPRSAPKDYWPTRTERLPEDDQRRHIETVAKSSGPIRIDLLPADGRVPRGLASSVFIRTTNRETGEPLEANLVFRKADGIREGNLPLRLQTDALGLARLDFTAVTDQTWELAARESGVMPPENEDPSDEQESRAKLHIKTVPTQVSLEMNDVLAVGGQPADGGVYSLFRSGGLMVDLYNADDWIDAAAFGIRPDQSGIRVEVPELDEEAMLYRVQVYKSIYDPGGAWDIDYLVAADGTELSDYKEAAAQLARHLAEHHDDPYFDALANANTFEQTTSPARLRGWIEAMLEAVPRHFDAPNIAINSQKEARDELAAWKESVKDDLILLTALALLIGLAVMGYLVIRGIQSHKRQNQLLRDVELDIDADDASEPGALERSIAQADLATYLQIFIVGMTLVFFTLGILLLLSYL